MVAETQTFNRHMLWSSLDANAKADLLLQDIEGLWEKLHEAQWVLLQNSNAVPALRQSIAQLSDSIDDLSGRVAALGK